MTTLHTRLRSERGIALVFALMFMTVLTIVGTSMIVYSTQSQHESGYGKAKSYAYLLAENGINTAMAILRDPPDPATGIGNNALDKNVFCGLTGRTYITVPSITPAPQCALRESYDGGYVTWYGVLNQSTATWTITSTGHVTNPVAGSGEAVRTLAVKVTVHPTLTQPLNTPVWNYIYSTNGPSTPPTCDMDLNQSVTIASPLYVEGNLCLHNTSTITSGPLVVRGRLILDSKTQNWVGTNANKISDVHVVNGCQLKGGTVHYANCGANDNVFATVFDQTPPSGLSPPTVNWDNWYLNASPGPYFPCTTTTGTPPTFDSPVSTDPAATDATRLTFRNNNLATQNLTPSTSYSCKTAGGELTWDATAKNLTIKGTVFVDGSLYVQNNSVNTYSGQGVIYMTGTLLIKSASLCGAVYNGACDLRTYQASPRQGWDPNSTLICFVANGNGGQVTSGDSIQLVSGTLQGAAYATYGLNLDTTSNVDGPLVGAPVKLGQSVTTSFPSITIVPDGMPSNPTAYAYADSPTGYTD
jgi:Tfp pilus assembly protein PilX